MLLWSVRKFIHWRVHSEIDRLDYTTQSQDVEPERSPNRKPPASYRICIQVQIKNCNESSYREQFQHFSIKRYTLPLKDKRRSGFRHGWRKRIELAAGNPPLFPLPRRIETICLWTWYTFPLRTDQHEDRNTPVTA